MLFTARIAEGALLVAGQLNDTRTLYSAAYIIQYSSLFALLFSALGFIGMAYVVMSILWFIILINIYPELLSGQHTYSEIPRIAAILRTIGLLGLAGLGLCIAGGVIATQDADQNVATALRRAGVCVYAGIFAILIAVHIGTWTYRWHLRSYRRSVSSFPFCPLHILCTYSDNLLFTAFVWYYRRTAVSGRTDCLRCHLCLVFLRSLRHRPFI